MVNPSDLSAFDFHDHILVMRFPVNGSEIESNCHGLQTLTIVLNLFFLTKELFVSKANCSLVGEQIV